MDAGALNFVNMFAPVVASFAAILTVVVGVSQGMSGHQRGDYSAMKSVLVWGTFGTGVIYTAPKWIPVIITAVSAIGI